MELHAVTIDKPEDMSSILGQAHFINTIEDLYEALAGAPRTSSSGSPSASPPPGRK